MSDELACPYCNAQFPHAQAELSGRALTCPRCGERLPAEIRAETGIVAHRAAITAQPAKTGTLPQRPGNRTIALALLVVMIGIGLSALVFALNTTGFRRANDHKAKVVEPLPMQAPTEWAALGYLPANCNLLAGMQIADLLADPAGKKLLAEPRTALLDVSLKNFEKWTGLTLDELDHIVVGVNLDGKLPQLQLAASTRQPCRLEERKRAFKLDKLSDLHGKPLFAFRPQLGEGRLWCPDPQTLVVVLRLDAFKAENLDSLPFPARGGSDGFGKELQQALSTRVRKQSVFWICGHGDWQPMLALLPRDKVPNNTRNFEELAKVKTFGLSVTLQKDLVLDGQLFTGDPAASRSVKELLEGDAGKGPLQVAIPPADVEPAEQWVTLQRRMSVEELRRALGEPTKSDK